MNENHDNHEIRKLYRSETEKKVAGVCGGLAEHFETDPTLLRAIMIVLMVCGPGLLLYPVLWVMVPKQPGPVAPAETSVSYSPA